MLTRRELLKRATRAGIAAALMPAACTVPPREPDGVWVNDVHSQLNRTRVLGIERPTNIEALKALVIRAGNQERSISVMGGRHAMGGQQFGSDTFLIDMNGMQGIHEFDAQKGEVEIGAGMQWPELIAELLELQRDRRVGDLVVNRRESSEFRDLGVLRRVLAPVDKGPNVVSCLEQEPQVENRPRIVCDQRDVEGRE